MTQSIPQSIQEIAKTLTDVDYETTLLIEEMSELMQVICKFKRKVRFPAYTKYSKENLYEELSHVEISLSIIKYLLDVDAGLLDEHIRKRLQVMQNSRKEIAP